MNGPLKAIAKALVASLGYQIKPLADSNSGPVQLWDDEKYFNEIYRQIIAHTLVSKRRCFILYQFSKQTARVPGDVAEVGVYKGGTAKLLAKSFESSHKSVRLFDTFNGMPPTNPEKDAQKEGDFSDTSFEDVRIYLNDCTNVFIYSGFFPETAEPVKDKEFCLVHIDVDIYRSVMDSCNFYYPRMQRGSIMIFDDYGDRSCPGAKMAVDEFFENKPENPCYLPTGQCIVMRL